MTNFPTERQSLEAQNDLSSLCQEHELQFVDGLPGNGFYGHAAQLRAWARWPDHRPIRAVLPHGVALSPWRLWEQDARGRVPAVLGYPEVLRASYEAVSALRWIPSASPYVYASAMAEADADPIERRGMIFFPEHSTHHYTSDLRDDLVDRLAKLPDRHRPLTVCLGWRDVQLGRHRVLQAAGLRVVSAGHMYDPAFLTRFHHLCRSHEFSSGDILGSHVFLSVHSGCLHVAPRMLGPVPAIGFEMQPEDEAPRDNMVEVPPGVVDLASVPDIRRAFVTEDPDPVEQRRVTAQMLGTDAALSEPELHALFVRLERLDRWQAVVPRTNGPPRLVLPPRLHRSLASARRRVRARRRGVGPAA